MKRILLVLLLVGGGYYYHTQSNTVSFDPDAEVLLFTNEVCKKPCKDARKYLDRRVVYTEIVVEREGENWDLFQDHGGNNTLPVIAIGKSSLQGFNPMEVTTTLAQVLGTDALSSNEQAAYGANFDAAGEPIVVMYATRTCGYCIRAREYFAANNIAYVERDIERSKSARRDFETLWGSGTPLIFNGYRRMSGFNERKIDSVLAL